MKYIVLLRGINISGKNKISMNELKAGLEKIGFENVSTYLNSGNAIFQSEIDNKEVIKENIQRMIKERFNLEIPVYVTTAPELEDILKHTPEWWGTNNKEIYDNMIFIIPPTKYEEVYNTIGEPKENLEKKIGKVYEALIEDISFDGKYLIGRTKQDVPEEDGIIYIKNAGLTKMVNKFVNVEITDVKDYDLIGKLI